MDYRELVTTIGFSPKNNTVGILTKKYQEGYSIDVDFDKKVINYGDAIICESKTTQNFSQAENFVVLECVDRLLTKGYKPQNIVLEKTWPSGHGTSGRLDICVTREDGTEYLLIECKTLGKEFEKALLKLNKDGGQLFTYFKFSNKADVIMLYASGLNKQGKRDYVNEIIKIEDEYRTGDVKDFYEKWNKLTKNNGIFDKWVDPYNFESKALTIADLVEIKPEDSSFIFNRFLEILRHNVVSDKPNAFNKIFTLFLCKIYDEKEREGTTEELQFQWLEGIDDDVSFQLRLSDLYKNGMYEFLEKRVTDFSEEEFDTKYKNLDDTVKASLLAEFKKIRLEKNNEFAIKEVYDEKSFKENAKVVKQVIELLQGYKIRYATKQQYLSDFFELLLTTGLKQESGQFFTPVPIAQFIIKSLPIDKIVESKLKQGKANELLPYVIDYAAGSGHFITESMNEIQRLLDKTDTKGLKTDPTKLVDKSKIAPYDWALNYVYGIEKDYRLVKVGKVGCYLHGDGLANVIHSDGLARFGYSDYKGKLSISDIDFPKENKQFDVVVSNPPYSVAAFKNAAREYYGDSDFDLYGSLTDNSSEIECLFIERTKQLLKDGGVAGIILPNSILNNSGIYTKAREIVLQYFELIALAELGSNTFMATGTSTVVLFLKRRNNYDSVNLKESVDLFFSSLKDVTLNEIESPVAKYINHVWEGLSYNDYITLLKNKPNNKVENHEIYKEYRNKIKVKNDDEFWSKILEIEKEKIYYFILAYPQKVVLVKSGEKNAEKRFLGYEFSNRRGSEGIHPIQKGKTVEECTKLFDANVFNNPAKASTYIYKAFAGDTEYPISESMNENISRVPLVDMMTFDRVDFEKNIGLSGKKKVKIESQWEIKRLEEVARIEYGDRIVKKSGSGTLYPVYGGGNETFRADKFNRNCRFIISRFGMSRQCMRYVNGNFFLNDSGLTVSPKDQKLISQKFLDYYLFANQEYIYLCGRGVAQKNLDMEAFNAFPIPLPPNDVQAKIVAEIETIDKAIVSAKESILIEKDKITIAANQQFQNNKLTKLGAVCTDPMYGAGESAVEGNPETDYRYIRVTDINDEGGLNNEWRTAEKIDKKYILKEGDFLFARSGATAGKTFLYKDQYGKAIFAGYLVRFVPKKDKLISEYLDFLLKSDIYKQWVLEKRKGSAQPNINAQQFSSFEIPIISIEEQKKIISEIAKLEKQIHETLKIIEGGLKLKNGVLKKYL